MRNFRCALLTSLVGGFALTASISSPVAYLGQTGQTRILGEITAIDRAARLLTIKTETGEINVQVPVTANVARIPPGETSADKAIRISFDAIAVGERVFVRGTKTADGKLSEVTQVVVTPRLSPEEERRREEWRTRSIAGRVTEINSARKEIVVLARLSGGIGTVIIDASGPVRFARYAADSLRLQDAQLSTFAELYVGDQLRARGEKSTDGARLKAEEIVSGSFIRTGGRITDIDNGAHRLTVKHPQTGENVSLSVGNRSTLRRLTSQIIAAYEDYRKLAAAAGPGQSDEVRARARRIQQMIESEPLISLDDLKKGETILVTGSHGPDRSRVTAITLLTGDATFLSRLLQAESQGPQNPGLPGDILGGGIGIPDDPPILP